MAGFHTDRSRFGGVAIVPLASAFMIGALAGDVAAQMENPLEILAVRVREQGHACDTPIKAERDQRASKPMATVWVLQCSNASYRVVLHPDMGAQIEVIR